MALTAVQRDNLTHLPAQLILQVGEFSDCNDIVVLIKTCRVFGTIFKNAQHVNPVGQILLAQVTGRRSITSMKALYKQVEDLKRHCPHVLENGQTWNLVEVLKRAPIETIDFSQEMATEAEIGALLDAFEKMRKMTQPKRVLPVERQVRDEGIVSVIESLSEEEQDEFIAFSDLLSDQDSRTFHDLQRLDPSERRKHESIYETIDDIFLKTPPVEIAELLQRFIRVRRPDLVLFKEAYSQDIYGDIREFRSSACKANAAFFQFLRAFCPRLQKLTIAYSEKREDALYRFFSAPERRNTLLELEFRQKNTQDLHVILLSELHKEFADFLLNQPSLEGFNSYRFIKLFSLGRVLDFCPRVTTLRINTEMRYNLEASENIVQVFQKIADRCRNIRRLELRCDFRDSRLCALVKAIVVENKELRSITINSSHEYDVCLSSILESCPNLECLRTRHLAASFFPLLPSALPRLKSLDIPSFPSKGAFLYFLLHSPELVDVPKSMMDDPISKVLQLRRLNLLVHRENCPGRQVFAELEKWDRSVVFELHHLVWLHNGSPDIPEYGKKALEQDVEILRKGNLLEQLAHKICFEALMRQLEEDLYPYVYLTERIKGNHIDPPDPDLERDLQLKVQHELLKKHGNEGDGDAYFCDAMEQRNIEDLVFIFRMLNKEIQALRAAIRELQANPLK